MFREISVIVAIRATLPEIISFGISAFIRLLDSIERQYPGSKSESKDESSLVSVPNSNSELISTDLAAFFIDGFLFLVFSEI